MSADDPMLRSADVEPLKKALRNCLDNFPFEGGPDLWHVADQLSYAVLNANWRPASPLTGGAETGGVAMDSEAMAILRRGLARTPHGPAMIRVLDELHTLRVQVSAVRALAERVENDQTNRFLFGGGLRPASVTTADVLAALDGSSETGETPKPARLEPSESLRATSDDVADPYQRLADAIETSALDSALIELTVTQDGRRLDSDAGLYVLARCLDKAGFIAADVFHEEAE